MKKRDPQLALRLDSGVTAADIHWCDGAALAYLGGEIHLHLATDRKQAVLEGRTLHLPVPPEASPRQIQDAAEAWLRREAQHLIGAAIHRHAARLAVNPPRLALSFATKSGWVTAEEDCLRCNWHLIEQPAAVIDQVVARALARMPRPVVEGDLFAAFA